MKLIILVLALQGPIGWAAISDLHKDVVRQVNQVGHPAKRIDMIDEALGRLFRQKPPETLTINDLINLRSRACSIVPERCTSLKGLDAMACPSADSEISFELLWTDAIRSVNKAAEGMSLSRSLQRCAPGPQKFKLGIQLKLLTRVRALKLKAVGDQLEGVLHSDMAKGGLTIVVEHAKELRSLNPIPVPELRDFLLSIYQGMLHYPRAKQTSAAFAGAMEELANLYTMVGLQVQWVTLIESLPASFWKSDSLHIPMVALLSCGTLRLTGKRSTCKSILESASQQAARNGSKELGLLLSLEKVEVAMDSGELESAGTMLKSLEHETGLSERSRAWILNTKVRLALVKNQVAETADLIQQFRSREQARGETGAMNLLAPSELDIIRLRREGKIAESAQIATKMAAEIAKRSSDQSVNQLVSLNIHALTAYVQAGDKAKSKALLQELDQAFEAAPFLPVQRFIVNALRLANEGASANEALSKIERIVGRHNFYLKNVKDALEHRGT